MKFGSVCSGIEAASVAWHPLGWKAAWLAEIEPFPCAVLAHHYPDIPNLGDMTSIALRVLSGEVEAPDVFCGGTPCQAFSVAGLRESLADERGNLTLKFVEIADAIDHVRTRRGDDECIVFWENVPGVLSTKDNAFGCFLGWLSGEDGPLEPPGGKWANAGAVYGPKRAVAWRLFDAQFFGLAQRRRRVFVVASARKGFDPAQVLFEWDGLRRDTAPSREAGKIAPTIPSRSTAGGGLGTDFDCDGGVIQVCPTLRAGGNRTGGDRPPGTDVDTADSLIAYSTKLHNTQSNNAGKIFEERTTALDANSPPPALLTAMQVRRLTPVECERLQGFPDNYTAIPWRTAQEAKRKGISYETLLAQRGMTLRGPSLEECPDGPRYKALGNSWAVPNVRWIGQRIARQIESSTTKPSTARAFLRAPHDLQRNHLPHRPPVAR